MSRATAVRTVLGIQLKEVDISVKPKHRWYSSHEDRMPVMCITDEYGDNLFWLTKDAVDGLLKAMVTLRELPEQSPRTIISVKGH
jgi:hypothetical protein